MHRVDTEVGALRTVLLHRPGNELKRLTPRNSADLLFDGLPWVGRAQEEHDGFADALRRSGTEVLYLRDLVRDVLALEPARSAVLDSAVSPELLGPTLAAALRAHLEGLHPEDLTEIVMAGLAHGELRTATGLFERLAGAHDFIVSPLPNLLFTRDSSVWTADHVTITRPSMTARQREVALTGAVYQHHPRFAGTPVLYGADGRDTAWVEGGDVLLLAPGVLAIGVGQRTTPAGAESLALRAMSAGVAHTVLAVPIAQERATMHLDTVCTMVDADAVVMYPNVADTLVALPMTLEDGQLVVGDPGPFLEAAAAAMRIEKLRVIDTGLDPITAEREQWDDGNNTLAVAPGVVVAYERNIETNARLEAAGIEVIRIAGSELGSGRGGPRCMSAPILRDPL